MIALLALAAASATVRLPLPITICPSGYCGMAGPTPPLLWSGRICDTSVCVGWDARTLLECLQKLGADPNLGNPATIVASCERKR